MVSYVSIIFSTFIFIKTASAVTCFYSGGDLAQYCNIFDSGNPDNCNGACSDANTILSLIPASVPTQLVVSSSCGACVLIIQTSCAGLPIYTYGSTVDISSSCSRLGQQWIQNILNSQQCEGLSPCTPTPAPVLTPTPTPTSAPVPTASTPTPAPVPPLTPSSSSNGGVSCIAHDQTVFEENKGKVNVSTLKIGDKIMTHNGFRDFIGYIHKGSFQRTLIITTDT